MEEAQEAKLNRLVMLHNTTAFQDFQDACENEIRRSINDLLDAKDNELVTARADLKAWVKMARLLDVEVGELMFLKNQEEKMNAIR